MQEKLDKNRVLNNLKTLYDIGNTHDEKLGIVIDSIIDEVKLYCNYGNAEMPRHIESVIINICAEYLRANDLGIGAFAENQVKALTQGDTKIEYQLGSVLQSAAGYGRLGASLLLLNKLKRTRMV